MARLNPPLWYADEEYMTHIADNDIMVDIKAREKMRVADLRAHIVNLKERNLKRWGDRWVKWGDDYEEVEGIVMSFFLAYFHPSAFLDESLEKKCDVIAVPFEWTDFKDRPSMKIPVRVLAHIHRQLWPNVRLMDEHEMLSRYSTLSSNGRMISGMQRDKDSNDDYIIFVEDRTLRRWKDHVKNSRRYQR